MAAPVVSASPTSVTLNPGQFADVVITATDPDSTSGTGTFPVTDSQGNTSSATVSITISDPLTFGTATTDVSGVAVTKLSETAGSATYRVQA